MTVWSFSNVTNTFYTIKSAELIYILLWFLVWNWTTLILRPIWTACCQHTVQSYILNVSFFLQDPDWRRTCPVPTDLRSRPTPPNPSPRALSFVSLVGAINKVNWTLLFHCTHEHRRDIHVLWCISVYFSFSPHFQRDSSHELMNIPSFVIPGLSPGFRNSCPISIQ